MSFDLPAYLSERRVIVDAALDKYLPTADQEPDNLHASIRYSIFCGGKRLRPILALAAADAVGCDFSHVTPLACALECIHTFSLIHDDLPAIDDDALRRGAPTNHVVYGEAMAILAGDALLAFAFELIAECRAFCPADRVLEALVMVAQASGTRGMVGGQVSDIECEGRTDVDEKTVASIHERKTGALLIASLVAGARLCGASGAQENALRRYGEKIGLAFQITDDILDLEGDAEKLGKPLGSDLKQDKATYPKILGIEESRTLANRAAEDAIAALSIFDEKADPLRALARYMVERDN
ncbi:farnesyl-diphosphate synthase [Capsulimonas corticalis]|uniref:Farnesyl-diphosphate synthase n=1 Tax=Capsulimonas corticalis TaxID=2219043 RepID=A0A402CTP2_9BACT|nr:farnesyl diphosphate synthase [Capsulimonas corticalis]BDI30673.1 farnesyl-diphosphate synthase [Capsulimonas corticalis]